MEDKKNLKTITGIVYSAKKDHNGKVISVLIDSLDEDQEMYKVSPGRKGDDLLELINKTVEISGTVSEDAKGDLFITVVDYTLLKES
jgi:hypothetical protein